jgi:hypothetical protein
MGSADLPAELPTRVVASVEITHPGTIARAWRHLGAEGRAQLLRDATITVDPSDLLLPISWRRPEPDAP